MAFYRTKDSLAVTHPEIAAQWHPTKNFPLTPSDVTYGSEKRIWWKCDISENHEWEAFLKSRTTNESGCPYCAGRKINLSNCLSTTHPVLIKEWHPTKNLHLTPFNVTSGMTKKVWWKCPVAEDHEWEAQIFHRANNNVGCPCCNSKKPVLSNCIATTHPELIKKWHPTKNLPLTPFDVVSGSTKKVWWKCDKAEDHEWEASLNNRTNNGTGCPYCTGRKTVISNCLATTHPELSKQWHPTKNFSLTPYNITLGSNKKVWWKCSKSDDHEWQSTIQNRTSGENGCPCCAGDKVVLSNCLAIINPEIANEWHPTKNINFTPFDVVTKSSKKVWWKCSKSDDHEWISTVYNRTYGRGCPYCDGKKVALSNCLSTTHPEISNQWHPTKNLHLTPFDVVAGSNKKVWWKCDIADDHEWESMIVSRTKNGTGCPCCAGQKTVMSNCIAMTHPYLIKEWHPTKNFPLTTFDVPHGSIKKVWWKCPVADDHEWQATILHRTYGSGCPFCSESRGEKKIKNVLDEMNISYDIEKSFNDCKCKNPLPFDFYLPKYNALIEYDGIQHFEPVEHFGGVNNFNLTQKRDKIKNDFAAKNNMPLLRIPYTKFDSIEEEIMAFISKLC